MNSDNDDKTIVWLPWDKKDVCGHTDGILRFVGAQKDGKPVVLTNLSVYDDGIATQMRNILMEYFYVIELKLSEYHELSWAYINALQTRDVIIVPGIGNTKLDNEAMGQFIALYPNYRGRIYQVQMKEFIEKWGGALNCCSWTISEDMSKLHHDIENDKRFISIIEKYQKDSNSVCFDEIRFLGDYYPRKLENYSRELDCLYFGF